MKQILLLILLFLSSVANSQTPVLTFDGINDYVTLGTSADNVRTIELWFSPDININSSNPDFVSLIVREEAVDVFNIHEFSLVFQRAGLPNPGTIRFNYSEDQNNTYSIYSDNNSWDAGVWYHVAAVIDPVNGMRLFINGELQSDSFNYTSAITPSSDFTAIGCWGANFDRLFTGKIDDVHFATEALYSSNFTPPCPNRQVEPSTIALWNVNDGSGTILSEESGNGPDGTISGATWNTALICGTTNIDESTNLDINIYPNPFSDRVFIESTNNEDITKIKLTDSSGKTIESRFESEDMSELNLQNLKQGVYFLHIEFAEDIRTFKLIKK